MSEVSAQNIQQIIYCIILKIPILNGSSVSLHVSLNANELLRSVPFSRIGLPYHSHTFIFLPSHSHIYVKNTHKLQKHRRLCLLS